MDVPDPIILSDHPASGGTAETGYDPESDVLLYHAVQTDRSGMPDARFVSDHRRIRGSRYRTSGRSGRVLKDAG